MGLLNENGRKIGQAIGRVARLEVESPASAIKRHHREIDRIDTEIDDLARINHRAPTAATLLRYDQLFYQSMVLRAAVPTKEIALVLRNRRFNLRSQRV